MNTKKSVRIEKGANLTKLGTALRDTGEYSHIQNVINRIERTDKMHKTLKCSTELLSNDEKNE